MKMKSFRNVLAAALVAFVLPAFAQGEETPVVGTLDLDLARAIEIALAENPTIRVADKDVELKKIANKEAWQNLLPSLDAQLALQHSIKVAAIKTQMGEFKMGMDGSTTAQGSLNLTLPIFAPAVYQNMKMTKDDILLAQEKARGSRLDLINQVTKAYYGALLAKDSYGVIRKNYELTLKTFEIVSKNYEVGRVSEYDKISADVQTRSMKSAVVTSETALNLALLRLKVLMGVTENVDININDDLRNYENDLTLADVDNAILEIGNNTNLRQLDYNTILLKHANKILKTNFLPTVAAQAAYQYQSYSNPNWNIFKYHYSPSSTLSFAVSIPIFHVSNWTKLKSNKVQMSQLQDTRENTERQIKMAVESYRRNMASTIAQVESNKEAIAQADKAVEISTKRYEVGRGTILELNQSETAQVQAALTYSQTIYDYLTNKADLEYTIGRETYIK